MKKKIINGILLVALMLTATTSFVSCKDNVDDELSSVYANLAKQKSDLEKKISDLTTTVNNLQSQVDQNTSDIANNATKINNNSLAILALIAEVDSVEKIIDTMNVRLDSIDSKIASLEGDVNKLKTEMDSMNTRVTKLETDLANIESRVQAMINSTVVDLVVNHTVNRVIGSINLPGVNALALSAFYAEKATALSTFPTTLQKYNVYPDDEYHVVLADEIKEKYSFGKATTITDENSNAGKIFFTVSTPDTKNNFDIKDWTLSLENSNGVTADVKITNAQPSKYLIHWGLYKSQTPWLNEAAAETAENGFFMADATIAPEYLSKNSFASKNFMDMKELEERVKTAVDKIRAAEGKTATAIQIAKEAAQIIQNFYSGNMSNNYENTTNSTWFPQQLVMTKKVNDSTTYRVQSSEYNIACSAVKPLSYHSFIELEEKAGNRISFARLESAVARLAEKIKAKLPTITLSKVKIAEITYTKDRGYYITLSDGATTIDVDNDIAKPIIEAINSGLSNVDLSNMIQGLDKVNNLGTEVDNYADRLTNAINRLGSKIINSFKQHQYTRALAPCIFFEGSEGIDRLQDGLSINKGIMTAYMSSPTEELLAPAYKKYLAVKDPNGNVTGQLYDGTIQKTTIDLSQAGDYTVIFSCVDYYGYVCTKRYTLHIK